MSAREHPPIDGIAENLLGQVLEQADLLRLRLADEPADMNKLRKDHEALRRLAARLTRSGTSPIPPLEKN